MQIFKINKSYNGAFFLVDHQVEG